MSKHCASMRKAMKVIERTAKAVPHRSAQTMNRYERRSGNPLFVKTEKG